MPAVVTAVVGAGPAGLLFAILGRLLAPDRDAWAIHVYDKRATYARNHRLRIDLEAYTDVQRVARDRRIDDLVAFLRAHDCRPEVNVLEEHLLATLESVGLRREILEVASLSALRERLAPEMQPETKLTVVAADSVHSTVRELVRGDVRPTRQTHERLARIRIEGDHLPARLGAVEQVRLSKVLGSVLEYHLNRNGYAEMDLFLTEPEHAIVRALGATPRAPVKLTPQTLSKLRAPLFRAIIDHVGEGRDVFVQSTFALEHAVMPRLTFDVGEPRCHVFLLGDAGISLPFQRGMACLARCALSLARVHRDLVAGDTMALARYDGEAREVVRRELSVVRSRAQIVGTLREIVRVSALLPFPIQSWWLRAEERVKGANRLSVWFFLNLLAACIALAFVLRGDRLAWLAVPVQMVGGIVYHSALAFEGGTHKLVRRIWEVQIALLFLVAAVVHMGLALVWWLILAVAFVVGLYLFERIVSKWFSRARL
jgi:2-polyprenyl-6-methoxyphenol hydroxylase-like FAD-dependent oxidoreductase